MNTLFASLLLFVSSGVIETELWQNRVDQKVWVNGNRARWLRFVRKSGVNNHLYGEHISLVTDTAGRKILGFVKLDGEQPRTLPTRAEAKHASDIFLQKIAPDLLPEREILWIKPHDERLRINDVDGNQQERIVRGMKVKAIDHGTGLYFWTVVDGLQNVYIFEREIKWITFPGKRATEQWLHDDWIAKHGGLPQQQKTEKEPLFYEGRKTAYDENPDQTLRGDRSYRPSS